MFKPSLVALALLAPVVLPAGDISMTYVQNNLVSDIPGLAANTDPNLQNAWGVSFSSTSPFWISDNHSGVSTLYNGSGQPVPLVVTIPPPLGGTPPASPTGQIFNATSAFTLSPNSPALFIFATEDGTISGWNTGTSAVLKVDNSASGAVYKGLAIGSGNSGPLLYAANFHNGTVDVFDGNYNATTVSGGFNDPGLPAGYAPFNVQNINGKLYVTYALQDADKMDDVPGLGHGFVDVFDMNGNLQERLISQGPLDSPWGVALAPASFGAFGGDLLVGNFGNGWINAFDPSTGAFAGSLEDTSGNPLAIDGLWALTFGNGAEAGDPNTLYFTAGPNDEQNGLFGDLTNAPEPGTIALFAAAGIALAAYRRFGRH